MSDNFVIILCFAFIYPFNYSLPLNRLLLLYRCIFPNAFFQIHAVIIDTDVILKIFYPSHLIFLVLRYKEALQST